MPRDPGTGHRAARGARASRTRRRERRRPGHQHRSARRRGLAAGRLGAHPRRLRDVEDRRGGGAARARGLQLLGRELTDELDAIWRPRGSRRNERTTSEQREGRRMGAIIGMVIGYVLGTRAGERGCEELRDAVADDLHARRRSRTWWSAGSRSQPSCCGRVAVCSRSGCSAASERASRSLTSRRYGGRRCASSTSTATPRPRSALVARITEVAGDDHFKFMEVCGGHTHTIYRHGIEHVLPSTSSWCTGPAARCA